MPPRRPHVASRGPLRHRHVDPIAGKRPTGRYGLFSAFDAESQRLVVWSGWQQAVTSDNLATLYDAVDDGALAIALPKFVKKELEGYLDCGLLCRGFARLRCDGCEETRRYRKGVAWTQRTTGARDIILSAAAPATVLAHELGHFFGNGHSSVPDNLMSYTRSGGKAFLDDAQVARVHAFATKLLAAGRLTDVGPGNSPAILDSEKE